MLYDFLAALFRPAAWWGRMRVEGLEHVRPTGPLLVVPNHDSQWDPILVALAIKPRRRLRFLARGEPVPLDPLARARSSTRLGQIPIRRGAGDRRRSRRRSRRCARARRSASSPRAASRGARSCARARASRAWRSACPGVQIVLCTVEGATDYARFPRRPRVRVTFLRPAAGDPQPGEEAPVLAARLLDEVRDRVAPVPAGRRARVGGPPRVRKRLASSSSFPILKILVPQSGHVPWIAGRPFFIVTCCGSLISTFLRSLTQ